MNGELEWLLDQLAAAEIDADPVAVSRYQAEIERLRSDQALPAAQQECLALLRESGWPRLRLRYHDATAALEAWNGEGEMSREERQPVEVGAEVGPGEREWRAFLQRMEGERVTGAMVSVVCHLRREKIRRGEL